MQTQYLEGGTPDLTQCVITYSRWGASWDVNHHHSPLHLSTDYGPRSEARCASASSSLRRVCEEPLPGRDGDRVSGRVCWCAVYVALCRPGPRALRLICSHRAERETQAGCGLSRGTSSEACPHHRIPSQVVLPVPRGGLHPILPCSPAIVSSLAVGRPVVSCLWLPDPCPVLRPSGSSHCGQQVKDPE